MMVMVGLMLMLMMFVVAVSAFIIGCAGLHTECHHHGKKTEGNDFLHKINFTCFDTERLDKFKPIRTFNTYRWNVDALRLIHKLRIL